MEYVVKDLLNDEEDFGDPREARTRAGGGASTPRWAATARSAGDAQDPQQAKLDAERREAAQRLARPTSGCTSPADMEERRYNTSRFY